MAVKIVPVTDINQLCRRSYPIQVEVENTIGSDMVIFNQGVGRALDDSLVVKRPQQPPDERSLACTQFAVQIQVKTACDEPGATGRKQAHFLRVGNG